MTCLTCSQPTANAQCMWCRHAQRITLGLSKPAPSDTVAAAVLLATLKTYGHACCPNP